MPKRRFPQRAATLYWQGDSLVDPGLGKAVTGAGAQGPAGPAGPPGADGAGVPIGAIILWSGTIATIPATWALCDGTSNAPGPDLRDKFVVGASQDSGGLAKTNLEGALSQTGGSTAHLHSAHGNLTHAGGAVGDHTGLTHGLSVADHPDLTHAALSHAASTYAHADHSVASQPVTIVGLTHADLSVPSQSVTVQGLTHADLSLASWSGGSAGPTISQPTQQFTVASATPSRYTQSQIGTGSTASAPTHLHTNAATTVTLPSHPTHTGSVPATTITRASHPTHTGSAPAVTLTHDSHSFPSLSHQDIGTHKGTDYGVHAFTAPPAHGTAGTLTHSFTQPGDHTISLHDTVSNVIPYFALAFIQRMS